MWNDGYVELTIPLDHSNMATFYSVGSFASYEAFMATAEVDDYDANLVCLTCNEATEPPPAFQREEWKTPKEVQFGDSMLPQDQDDAFVKE